MSRFWPISAAVIFLILLSPIDLSFADAPERDQNPLFQQADEIFQEVSRLRGLPIKAPVQKRMADKAFFQNYYTRLLEEQYPPEKKRSTEKAYALFGLLPAGSDLIQTYLSSFLGSVQGLYDPASKTLYIADWIDPDKSENVLAHELDHALQDQNFDLKNFFDRGKGLSMDAQFARASLVEGEATAIAMNYSLEDKGKDFTQLVNIADWVRLNHLLEESGQKAFGRRVVFNEVINFPYVFGTAFLQKYIRAYGWKGMKTLFEHPPSSTHQIMHPESYFPRRQKSIRIKVENLSASVLRGFNLIWEDTFGEYGLNLLLKRYLPEKEVRASTRGWRGDRFQVYEQGDHRQSAVTAYLLFDNGDQAEDFFKSYRVLLGRKYELGLFRRSDETIHWATIRGGDMEVYVERLGRRVVLIEGTDARQTPRVRAALWNVIQSGKGRDK